MMYAERLVSVDICFQCLSWSHRTAKAVNISVHIRRRFWNKFSIKINVTQRFLNVCISRDLSDTMSPVKHVCERGECADAARWMMEDKGFFWCVGC